MVRETKKEAERVDQRNMYLSKDLHDVIEERDKLPNQVELLKAFTRSADA